MYLLKRIASQTADGERTLGQPNIGSTICRTASDHKNKRYYYESTRSPNVFWVDLRDIDFTPGTSPKKLTLTSGANYTGNVAAQFQPAAPFPFLPARVN